MQPDHRLSKTVVKPLMGGEKWSKKVAVSIVYYNYNEWIKV